MTTMTEREAATPEQFRDMARALEAVDIPAARAAVKAAKIESARTNGAACKIAQAEAHLSALLGRAEGYEYIALEAEVFGIERTIADRTADHERLELAVVRADAIANPAVFTGNSYGEENVYRLRVAQSQVEMNQHIIDDLRERLREARLALESALN